MFVVFEGIDSSGKETQSRLLEKFLRNAGWEVYRTSFPNYKGVFGKVIKEFLDGRLDLGPEERAMLYALDRVNSLPRIKEALDNGKIVIADRYCYSNVAYHGSLGVSVNWIGCLESRLVFPDLVIFLDIPVNVSLARKRKKDRYESNKVKMKNSSLLELAREAYVQMANGTLRPFEKYGDYSEWVTIDGTRSIEDVHSDIVKIVKARLPREEL